MTIASPTDVTVWPANSTLSITTDLTMSAALNKIGAGTLALNNVRGPELDVTEGVLAITGIGNAGTSRINKLDFPLTRINLIKADLGIVEGKLDLKKTAMVIDYTAGNSPVNDVRGWLKTGFNNGSWNGVGIQSSSAAAVAANAFSPIKTGIGYRESSGNGTFFGQPVDGSSLELQYTLFGDANLDGAVSTIDFGMLSSNFNSANAYWWRGDFNYDGFVNALDFNAIVSNWGGAIPADLPATLVPEPAFLSALAIPALLTRRRRRTW